jgi:hypothetical protein
MNRYWHVYVELMRGTWTRSIAAAAVLLLFVIQEAATTIQDYVVAESNTPSIRTHFEVYLSWLAGLFVMLLLRIYVLMNSSRRGYAAIAINSVVLFCLLIAFLYEFLPRSENHTFCDGDGICFTLYELSRPVYLFLAAGLYVVFGMARACITFAVAVIVANRRYK